MPLTARRSQQNVLEMETETYTRETCLHQPNEGLIQLYYQKQESAFPLYQAGTRLRIHSGPAYSVRETYLGANDRENKNALRQILVVQPIE